MSRTARTALAAAAMLATLPAAAQTYVGVQTFHSDDGDDTTVTRAALDFDWTHTDDEHYHGVSVETARYRPFGLRTEEDLRVFYRFAAGDAWKWTGRIGSDGDTVIGSASVHNEAPRRQEYFIERDIIETPQGLEEGLYSTFAGAAFDHPLGERTLLTTVVGLQDFGGDNLRTHVRANLIRTLSEEHGLTAQLRVRAFDDSDPHEADYFAPGRYVQVLPTLQMRRFVDGWRFAVAAGYGTQRESGESWRPAHLFEASVTSPPTGSDWTFRAGVLYTNTPGPSGTSYDYRQVNVSVGRTF